MAAVVVSLLVSCAAPRVVFNDALRQELLHVRDADQRVRSAAFRATNFHGVLEVGAAGN